MRSNRRALVRLGAVAAAAALLATGCANSGDSAGGDSSATAVADLQDGMVNVAEAEGEPVEGGELSFAAYSEPKAVDPAKTIAAVTTGGLELVNVYDSLMRYDTESQSVVPQMAEGLTHSDDYRTWTMTLRDGVEFSDGTPLDAAAVKASQERYAQAKGPEAGLWTANVAGISTPDERTVVYELDKTWPEFDVMLTSGPGMIVAPSAGPPGEGFTPIGAGPFTLGEWRQGESMTLKANPDYWGGKPHLDAVKVVYMPTMEVSKETFFNDGVDMTFVREPDDVTELLGKNLPGYVNMTSAANTYIINAAPGRPGSDPRVRKAIQLATDPSVLAQRAYGDPEYGESELFPEYSRWHTDAAGPEFDPERAKKLVAEAKADGVGTTLVSINSPEQARQQQALALEAQLEAVGFDVDTKIMPTIGDQIRVIGSERNYDLGAWGLSYRESDPFAKMFDTMHSGGKQLYGMSTSPEMDVLVDQFQTATDKDAKLQAMAQIQQQVNEDVPFINIGYFAEYTAWHDNVHGVEGSSNSMILLGDAWKA
ncbi:ABC transporter substrate-binding protein [Tomitella fengzijianii]|uniref:ABC transporter substrate-binding protein n=1 Tax=Tomitella fengzijianii TaxID=2597660 RepID=A0A516WZB0_9ACTN|nr:ABC transporter substrate-binding protein [Tomitella fengzijianii]QDQ96135.1 ABC transporter substrate-binding protein [Tomitella fengzijianii]